jgi:hypothetical protein
MTREREKLGKHSNSAKYVVTGLFLLLFTMVSTGLLLPGTAKAEEGYGPGTDKWKFELGGFFPAVDTRVKIDGTEVGDTLDLEGLGLSSDESVWRLDGYWRFAQKHRLGIGYYKLGRDGSVGLAEEITIGDIIIPVNASVTTELDMGFYSIDYLYSFYQGEKWEISGGLGVYWVDLEFSIGASLNIDGTEIGGGPFFESTDFNGPLPYLALSFEYYITPKWLAIFKGGYFALSVGDVDGSLANLGAKLEYQFTQRFGLGLGYDAFRIDVDIDDGALHSTLEYKYHGVQLYGILRF